MFLYRSADVLSSWNSDISAPIWTPCWCVQQTALERQNYISLYSCNQNLVSHQNCTFTVLEKDSSVGIETFYGLDGPGIGSRWGWDFKSPVQTGPGGAQPPSCRRSPYVLLGGNATGVWRWPSTHIYRRGKRKSRATTLLHLWGFMALI